MLRNWPKALGSSRPDTSASSHHPGHLRVSSSSLQRIGTYGWYPLIKDSRGFATARIMALSQDFVARFILAGVLAPASTWLQCWG